MDFITFDQLKQSIPQIAANYGYSGGNLYAERQSLGTMQQELDISDIWLKLPRGIRTEPAHRLVRAYVLSCTAEEKGVETLPQVNGKPRRKPIAARIMLASQMQGARRW